MSKVKVYLFKVILCVSSITGVTKDELERSSKSKPSKRKKAPAEDIGDDDALAESDDESSSTPQAQEDRNVEELTLPDSVVPGVAFWLVINTATDLVDEFATTVKTMFLDAGFTFCDCSVSRESILNSGIYKMTC